MTGAYFRVFHTYRLEITVPWSNYNMKNTFWQEQVVFPVFIDFWFEKEIKS